MKRPSTELTVLIVIIILALFVWNATFAREIPGRDTAGIQFFKGSWSQALEKAKQENKTIFVDFYADWCGPCKYMSKSVFTDSTVGAFFEKGIIAMQINAEQEEKALVKEMRLNAYPTLAIFDAQGKKLSSYEGALESDALITFIKSVTEFDLTLAAYKSDSTNVEKFTAYIDFLTYQDADQANAMTLSYLNRLPAESMKSQAAWDLIVKRVADYNSPAFDFVTANMAWYEENCASFDENYFWFVSKMMSDAADSRDQKVVDKAFQSFMALRTINHSLTQGKEYYKEAFQIAFHHSYADTVLYRVELPLFLEKYHAKDADFMAANALELLASTRKGLDASVELKCIELAKKANNIKSSPYTLWALGLCYRVNGQFTEARKTMLQAIKGTKDSDLVMSLDFGGTISIPTPPNAVKTVTAITASFN